MGCLRFMSRALTIIRNAAPNNFADSYQSPVRLMTVLHYYHPTYDAGLQFSISRGRVHARGAGRSSVAVPRKKMKADIKACVVLSSINIKKFADPM
jgi:hypothetical protein